MSESSGPKHVQLGVVDYDHTGGGDVPPRTYLQLGAFPSVGTPVDRGDDMLDRVGVTEGVTHYFKDDYRYRNGQQHPATKYWRDDGYQNVPSDPVTLTSELRTRGGMRLHTDGNYISTTRGDRVDVIGGNYKMVILGRVDAPGTWGESYYESSGGHNRDATNTPGERIMVAWNPATQTWRTVDEVIRGDVVANYQGIVREFYECDLMLSFVGSADEGAPIPVSEAVSTGGAHTHTDFTEAWIHDPPRPKQNPNITETVRALTITGITKVETTGGAAVTTDTTPGIVHPIVDQTITETAAYRTFAESVAATIITEELTVESGALVSERVGEGPPLGSPPGTPPVAPVPCFRDTLIAGAISSLTIYQDKTVMGGGLLTQKVDIHNRIFEMSIGLEFDHVDPAFGRHEITFAATGFKFALAASLFSVGVKVGLDTTFKLIHDVDDKTSTIHESKFTLLDVLVAASHYRVSKVEQITLVYGLHIGEYVAP